MPGPLPRLGDVLVTCATIRHDCLGSRPAIVLRHTHALTPYRGQRDRAGALDEPQRQRKIAHLAAAEQREPEAVYDRHALGSFASWGVRRKREIERTAPLLDRQGLRDEERRAARAQHDVQQSARSSARPT
jgi:hypothetical protein